MISDNSQDGKDAGDVYEAHRQNDPPIHIDRKIPLWGLLGVIAIIALQAVLMYVEQREQGTTLRSITVNQSEANKQLTDLAKELGNKNLKDVEHDMKFTDIERRMAITESVLTTIARQRP